MKYFNFRLFLVLWLLLCVIAYMSFNAAAGIDDGTLGASSFDQFLAGLFRVMRFPTHVILTRVFLRSPFLFALGLAINSCFFALVVERLFYFILKLIYIRDDKDHE